MRAKRSGAAYEIELDGELDMATCAALDEALREAATTDASEIVVDLSGLLFMDCSGLRCLVAASRDRGLDRLQLRPGRERVQRVFDITHTREHVRFVATG